MSLAFTLAEAVVLNEDAAKSLCQRLNDNREILLANGFGEFKIFHYAPQRESQKDCILKWIESIIVTSLPYPRHRSFTLVVRYCWKGARKASVTWMISSPI